MLTLIPTPIGNIADITFRALELIKSCDLILCEDTRVAKHLLQLLSNRYNLELPNVDIVSFHEHNQESKLPYIKDALSKKSVLYLSDAGMPAISDPGQYLVEYCQKEGIEYDILPGASAVPLVYAASGFESGRFYFYGFLPKKGKERGSELAKILDLGIDTIIYEAPHRIEKLANELAKIDKNIEIFAAKELTKRYQRYFRGKVEDFVQFLQKNSTKGEWAVVVKPNNGAVDMQVTLQDILDLDIPPKPKAKLLAKATGKSIKECYEELKKS
jgi:16S rRNA (cytidine1402-2'-O)-methyltransferase